MKTRFQVVILLLILAVGVFTARSDNAKYDNLELGIPGECDQIINREGYALGFSREHKQPLWVAYRISKEEAQAQVVARNIADFYEDSEVKGSATLADYKRSGYDRGHLAPAGDMKFSSKAMRESFSMANMSPQNNSFNSGAWNRLEQAVRNFAIRENSIFVVTGPIFIEDEEPKYIGASKIRVPEFYYKVIYDETPPEKMIGFIMANKGSKKPLSFFAVTVDEVEDATGLDFFSNLDDEKESNLESNIDISLWDIK